MPEGRIAVGDNHRDPRGVRLWEGKRPAKHRGTGRGKGGFLNGVRHFPPPRAQRETMLAAAPRGEFQRDAGDSIIGVHHLGRG